MVVNEDALEGLFRSFPHPLHQEFASIVQRRVATDYQSDGCSKEAWSQLYDDLGVSSSRHRGVIESARALVFRYYGPFIAKAAVDMLSDLSEMQAAVSNRRLRAVFVGRDALALSFAMHQIDPAFHYFYCRELAPISRAVTDKVVEQISKWWPERLATIHKYRFNGMSPHRSRLSEPTTWDEMLNYLHIDGVGTSHRLAVDDFVVVDTGYKGSIQEMLAAAFPQVSFRGMYIFHAATESARSPKKGYVLDLDHVQGRNGEAIRDRIIDNERLTFAHHDAIVAVEQMLCGGLDVFLADDSLRGIYPSRVAAHYRSREMRFAVLTASQMAVADYAAQLRAHRRRSGYWYETLCEEARKLPKQLHAWITNRPMDVQLRELLDSFICRADKDLVAQLSDHLNSHPAIDQDRVWALYGRRDTLRGKRKVVQRTLFGRLPHYR